VNWQKICTDIILSVTITTETTPNLTTTIPIPKTTTINRMTKAKLLLPALSPTPPKWQ
jgi:hypothetical protein